MKKYSKILILLVVPFLLTACTKKSQEVVGEGSQNQAMMENDDSSFTGTIMDLLKMGKSMKCTAKYTAEGLESDYTMYTMGDKVYSEMELDLAGEGKMNQRSIMADDMVYTWNPETKTGSKMSLTEFEGEDEEIETPEAGDVDYKDFKQEFDYKCSAWVPNPSLFSPPSDIEFVDMTAMMKTLQDQVENGDLGGMKESACAACNMVPAGEEREECLANLECE